MLACLCVKIINQDAPMVEPAAAGAVELLANVPLGRLSSPGEVGLLVRFLASDDSSYCTGQEFTIDGGLTA